MQSLFNHLYFLDRTQQTLFSNCFLPARLFISRQDCRDWHGRLNTEARSQRHFERRLQGDIMTLCYTHIRVDLRLAKIPQTFTRKCPLPTPPLPPALLLRSAAAAAAVCPPPLQAKVTEIKQV